jgi:hypothetical protein
MLAGAGLLGLLAMLLGLVSFVMFILVLIRQFKDAGPVHGIIGIVTCGIWTFIWGWMNAGRLGIKNIMLIWTICVVIGIALRLMGGGMMMMPTTPTTTP